MFEHENLGNFSLYLHHILKKAICEIMEDYGLINKSLKADKGYLSEKVNDMKNILYDAFITFYDILNLENHNYISLSFAIQNSKNILDKLISLDISTKKYFVPKKGAFKVNTGKYSFILQLVHIYTIFELYVNIKKIKKDNFILEIDRILDTLYDDNSLEKARFNKTSDELSYLIQYKSNSLYNIYPTVDTPDYLSKIFLLFNEIFYNSTNLLPNLKEIEDRTKVIHAALDIVVKKSPKKISLVFGSINSEINTHDLHYMIHISQFHALCYMYFIIHKIPFTAHEINSNVLKFRPINKQLEYMLDKENNY